MLMTILQEIFAYVKALKMATENLRIGLDKQHGTILDVRFVFNGLMLFQ